MELIYQNINVVDPDGAEPGTGSKKIPNTEPELNDPWFLCQMVAHFYYAHIWCNKVF